MEIQEYLIKKKKIQESILEYIDATENLTEIRENLDNLLKGHNYVNNRHELSSLLYLIVKITKNHHHTLHFYEKIENILSNFKQDIKELYSNSEIFDIFKESKRLLFYLLEERLFSFDSQIATLFLQRDKFLKSNYATYFYPEIKPLVDEQLFQRNHRNLNYLKEMLENESEFNRKRKIGNNYCYVCKLIRKDMIEKFVEYINQSNFSINSTIEPSIFETNSYLADKEPTLIEYAAFYGSIQIFKYLFLNNVQLTSSLWLYAIHGNNPEMIYFLEEHQTKPENDSYEECAIESLKCHHNNLANYIIENLTQSQENEEYSFIHSAAFKFFNYEYFPDNLENKFAFFDLCKYNHVTFVDLLVKHTKIDINQRVISNEIFFINRISNHFNFHRVFMI